MILRGAVNELGVVRGQFAFKKAFRFWPQFLGTPLTVSLNLGRVCRLDAKVRPRAAGTFQRDAL